MTYLENLLDTKIEYTDWEKKKSLPFYITTSYDIKKASLKGTDTIFLFPKGNLFPVNTIKTHIYKIQEIELLPVVVYLEILTYTLRQQFIKADIPFVAEEKQVYIPFIGVSLMERYTTPANNLKYFSPSTQLLLLYLIYKKTTKFTLSEIAEELGVSKMTISKAQKQLVQTKLFRLEQREGKRKALITDYDFKTIWETCLKYMISPIKEIVYMNKDEINDKMFLAGETALSEKSMLNPPKTPCYATFPDNKELSTAFQATISWNKDKTLTVNKYTTNDSEIKLELWKYNPYVLKDNNAVDILSLALSFKGNKDERLEDAIEEMLNIFWEEY